MKKLRHGAIRPLRSPAAEAFEHAVTSSADAPAAARPPEHARNSLFEQQSLDQLCFSEIAGGHGLDEIAMRELGFDLPRAILRIARRRLFRRTLVDERHPALAAETFL